MLAAASLLLVIALSLLVIRIGTVALAMTGLSEEIASFQSLSAFTGTGFTTQETEMVVGYPARRKVIRVLILLGNVGVITAISSVFLSFRAVGRAPELLLVLALGVLLLTVLARSAWLNRLLTRVIEKVLRRSATLDLRDYASLLRLRGEYSVVEMDVKPGDWLTIAPLHDLNLPAEGVLVLGIIRPDGRYIGVPASVECLQPGDKLIAYGQAHRLRELAVRTTADQEAHERAQSEHRRTLHVQQVESSVSGNAEWQPRNGRQGGA